MPVKPKAILDGLRSTVLRSYTERDPSGPTTFLSWERLAEALVCGNVLLANERIVAFVIEDGGINLCLEMVTPTEPDDGEDVLGLRPGES